MKLLIVEDESKISEYLRQGLTEAGFDVDLARSGLGRLQLAMTGHYDLLILDIMLPDVDGLRILKSRCGRGMRRCTGSSTASATSARTS